MVESQTPHCRNRSHVLQTNHYSQNLSWIHPSLMDPAQVMRVVVGLEDVRPVPTVGGLTLDHSGASPRDNNRWAVQPGILRGNLLQPVTGVSMQDMLGRIAQTVGRLLALVRGAE
ncbi:unnamed protein product [Prunus armeniaca]